MGWKMQLMLKRATLSQALLGGREISLDLKRKSTSFLTKAYTWEQMSE